MGLRSAVIRLDVLVFLALVGIAAASADAQTATGRSGLRIESVTHRRPGGAAVALTLAIWYPTTSAPGWYKYPYVWGRVTPNAPPAPGSWPLIVHSHGLYECGLASGSLHEALANAGYIVAAVDHDDATNCSTTGETRPVAAFNILLPNDQNFPFRTDDISAVLDFMTSSLTWRWLVDETRVGASGHSLGGWTIAARRDPRIQARLMWAPSYRLNPGFYADIAGPVAYIFGEFSSGYSSGIYRTWAYDNSPVPKFLGYVAGADHYSFTDKQCQSSSLTSTALCRSFSVPTAAIYAKSREFLDRYVKQSMSEGSALLDADPRYLIWFVEP